MSSNQVTLQADIVNAPANVITALGSVQPLLRALSADDVHPMAVLQIESIGSCFHLNGEMAHRIHDLLKRSKSLRLERLSLWVGWMAGDTASTMAETAGGKIGSLLAVILVELWGDVKCGEILYELSSKLLRPNRQGSTIVQLSRVAQVLSNKLAAIGFGKHLATHVTRLRETYFNARLQIPPTLLEPISEGTIVEFLNELHIALTEESSMLYFEGCRGVGYIVAILMALCPEDVLILVENEIIFEGQRRTVVVSIKSDGDTRFGVESILLNERVKPLRYIVSSNSEELPGVSYLRLTWNGFLADILDVAFLRVGARPTTELRYMCADLIAYVAFSMSARELCNSPDDSPRSAPLPLDALPGLLGPFAHNRVRDCLNRILNAEPSFTLTDRALASEELRRCMHEIVPQEACSCAPASGKCPYREYPWQLGGGCLYSEIWETVAEVVVRGIVSLFVRASPSTTVCMKSRFPCRLREAVIRTLGSKVFLPTDVVGWQTSFDMTDLHGDVLSIASNTTPSELEELVGVSCGSSSIFPSTLQSPVLLDPPCLEYRLEDGQFHDGRTYHQSLYCAQNVAARPRYATSKLKVQSGTRIIPSSLGVHSALFITARATVKGLLLRAIIRLDSKEIEVDFLDIHLGSMSVTMARDCQHDPRTPLEISKPTSFIVTSVAAPAGRLPVTAIALTHCSPEAQFLSCIRGIRALFQSGACLNCAVREAKMRGICMIIQS